MSDNGTAVNVHGAPGGGPSQDLKTTQRLEEGNSVPKSISCVRVEVS